MSREARVAERLIRTHSLEPPVKITELAREYASVEYDYIPTGCDGLVIGLHRPKPLILVEASHHETRQRFTLAHELGHILLPWHVGNFACDTDGARPDLWQAGYDEPQANRFAAELLIPSAWLDDRVSRRGDEKVGPLVEDVLKAGVSTWVACFRLAEHLPAGHVFAVVNAAEEVILSGQTKGTGVKAPARGEPVDHDRLDRFASQIERIWLASRTIIWWTYRDRPGGFQRPHGDSKQVLRELVDAHGDRGAASDDLYQSCSAIVGAAFGVAKREGSTNPSQLYARFAGRFAQERTDLPRSLLDDARFDRWLKLRAAELAERMRP